MISILLTSHSSCENKVIFKACKIVTYVIYNKFITRCVNNLCIYKRYKFNLNMLNLVLVQCK